MVGTALHHHANAFQSIQAAAYHRSPHLLARCHCGLLPLSSRLPLSSPLLLRCHQRLVLAAQPLTIRLQLLTLQIGGRMAQDG